MPAVVPVGCWPKTSLLADDGITAISVSLPESVLSTVSLAVIDWVPAVSRVTAKVCDPASAAVNV